MLVLAVAVVLLVVLSPDDDESEQAGSAARQEQQVPEVVVRDGRPVGGAIEMEATRGERIVFDVRSDAAEEIHVHGYDITRDIPAGGTARVAFRADLEGVYEAELHGSGAPIAELTVKPG